jgi:hypothetical protein
MDELTAELEKDRKEGKKASTEQEDLEAELDEKVRCLLPRPLLSISYLSIILCFIVLCTPPVRSL